MVIYNEYNESFVFNNLGYLEIGFNIPKYKSKSTFVDMR